MSVPAISWRTFEPGLETALREVYESAVWATAGTFYTREQCAVWAPEVYDKEVWAAGLKRLQPRIVQVGEEVVAFADVQPDGYIDHFFVHGQWQGRGIGKALMQRLLETRPFTGRFHARVSDAAYLFFLGFSFEPIALHLDDRGGVVLQSTWMERSV